jgi:hypothetical protein
MTIPCSFTRCEFGWSAKHDSAERPQPRNLFRGDLRDLGIIPFSHLQQRGETIHIAAQMFQFMLSERHCDLL